MSKYSDVDTSKELWTTQELADVAGVSDARIRQLLIEGNELKGEKFGAQWMIRRREATRWLKKRGINVEGD